MRRLCFLLLAFLFPMQLFAGMLEPAPKNSGHANARAAHVQMVPASMTDAFGTLAERLQRWATPLQLQLDADDQTVATAAADHSQESDHPQGQADLEDQTLPTALATLVLDWHPFPHLYPHVDDGSSAFLDLLLPPPLAAS